MLRPLRILGLSTVAFIVSATLAGAQAAVEYRLSFPDYVRHVVDVEVVFTEVTADSRRGDYEWAQWRAGKATVTAAVQRTGVPDGAPAPTATTAYVRVEFTQTVRPTAGAGEPTVTTNALNLLVSKAADGRWLVAQLLADV